MSKNTAQKVLLETVADEQINQERRLMDKLNGIVWYKNFETPIELRIINVYKIH